VTLFWSTSNTGGTFFRLRDNTAYVSGDRSEDSDEYDDAVILHEYAHMLAARFSRDDSPGGPHRIGDIVDPRIAWSEGWATFFSSAVRNDAIYRDSGGSAVRYDLEENAPAGDRPGYWSEASVQSILWDLFDDRVDAGDAVQFTFRTIWSSLRICGMIGSCIFRTSSSGFLHGIPTQTWSCAAWHNCGRSTFNRTSGPV